MSNSGLFGSPKPPFTFSPPQSEENKDIPATQNKPQFGTMQSSSTASSTLFGGVTAQANKPQFGFGGTQSQPLSTNVFGSSVAGSSFSPSRKDADLTKQQPSFGTPFSMQPNAFSAVQKDPISGQTPVFGAGLSQTPVVQHKGLFSSANEEADLPAAKKQKPIFGASTSSQTGPQQGIFSSTSKDVTQLKPDFGASFTAGTGSQMFGKSSLPSSQLFQLPQMEKDTKPPFGVPTDAIKKEFPFKQTEEQPPKLGLFSASSPQTSNQLFQSSNVHTASDMNPAFGPSANTKKEFAFQQSETQQPKQGLFSAQTQASSQLFQSSISQTASDAKPAFGASNVVKKEFSFQQMDPGIQGKPQPGLFTSQDPNKVFGKTDQSQSQVFGNVGRVKGLFGTGTINASSPEQTIESHVPNKLGRKRSLDDTHEVQEKAEKQAQLTNQPEAKKPQRKVHTGPAPTGLFSRAMQGADMKFSKAPPFQRPKPGVKNFTRTLTSRTPVRRKSSSGVTSPTDVSSSNSLTCKQVPEEFNNLGTLKEFFSRFGNVKLVRPNPPTKSAFVKFSTHEEAKLAKQKGTNMFGQKIILYFRRPPKTMAEKVEDNTVETSSEQQGAKVMKKPEVTTQKMMFQKKTLARTGSVRQRKQVDTNFTKTGATFYAKTDAEKLQLLEKIDKILRLKVVKESNLASAKITIGTCPDMCPEKERYLRLHRNLLASYELDSDKKLNHSLAVKEYSRSSADQEEALHHELRPSPVLRITMDYLLSHVMNRIDTERIADWYDFLWNRTRAIRKEISIQQLNDPMSVEVAEECARFHICCGHELCEEDRLNFDPKINNENLEKAMKSVLDMYGDIRSQQTHYLRNESEFLAYHILLNINKSSDVLRELRNMSDKIRESPDVKLAVAAFSAVHSNNYTRFFNVLKHATYLQAAILHRYFEQVRKQAIVTMARAYSTSKSAAVLPIEHIMKMLHLNDEQEMTTFCNDHMIPVKNGHVELSRSESYEAESGVTITKSHEVSMKLQGRNLGEVIAHNCTPSHKIHEPTSSFDDNGRYIGPHSALLSMDPNAEKPSEKPTNEAQDISKQLQAKGVNDAEVKVVAVQLFREVIEEMVLQISEEIIKVTVEVTASWKVCCDIIDDVINDDVCKLCHTEVVNAKLEREERIAREEQAAREAALRAQQEAERLRIQRAKEEEERKRKKEKEESMDRCAVSLADEMYAEVVTAMTVDIAKEEFRKARFDFLCDFMVDDITTAVSDEEAAKVATAVFKQERKQKLALIRRKLNSRLAVILFQRWQKVLLRVRVQRHAEEMFPSAPYQRHMRQQVSDLLPPGCDAKMGSKRHSFPLDKMRFCELTMEPVVRLYEKHGEAVDSLKDATRRNVSLRHSAMSEEYSLPSLFYNNYAKMLPEGDAFERSYWWKICIYFTQESANRNLVQWIRKKFDCSSDDCAISSENFTSDRTQVKVTACAKVICNTAEQKISNSDFIGSQNLIYVVTDDVPLSKAKIHLEMIARCKPASPPLSVLVIVENFFPSTVVQELNLESLQVENLLASYRILVLDDEFSFVENSKKLEDGLRFLASKTQPLPPICFKTLQEVLEEQISLQYLRPMSRHQAQREKQNIPHMEPRTIVEIYNCIIERVCEVLTKQELTEISWPPIEIVGAADAKVPSNTSQSWNAKDRFDEITDILASVQLPDFPHIASNATSADLLLAITSYCEKVCPHNHMLVSNIQTNLQTIFNKLLQKSYFSDDQFTLPELIPWQSVVDAVASSLFESIIYDKNVGSMVVGYLPMDMDHVKIPAEYSHIFAGIEFESMSNQQEDKERETQRKVDLSETLHSQTCGAAQNLSKILNQTTQVADNVNRWEVQDLTAEVIDEAAFLKKEIEHERRESQRFEARLEELLNDEGAMNYSFEPGDLSLLFS